MTLKVLLISYSKALLTDEFFCLYLKQCSVSAAFQSTRGLFQIKGAKNSREYLQKVFNC